MSHQSVTNCYLDCISCFNLHRNTSSCPAKPTTLGPRPARPILTRDRKIKIISENYREVASSILAWSKKLLTFTLGAFSLWFVFVTTFSLFMHFFYESSCCFHWLDLSHLGGWVGRRRCPPRSRVRIGLAGLGPSVVGLAGHDDVFLCRLKQEIQSR